MATQVSIRLKPGGVNSFQPAGLPGGSPPPGGPVSIPGVRGAAGGAASAGLGASFNTLGSSRQVPSLERVVLHENVLHENVLHENVLRENVAARVRDRGRRQLARSLESLGDMGEAANVKWCGRFQMSKMSGCGHVVYKRTGMHCDNPLCLECAHRRAGELAAAWSPVAERYMVAPAVIMLSQSRRLGESYLENRLRFMTAWELFRRRVDFKGHVAGALVSIETAYSEKGWGTHAHILADCKWWPQSELSRAWLDVTGDSPVVYIQRVTAGPEGLRAALAEVIKYPFKPAGILNRPELVKEYLAGCVQFKSFRQYGTMAGGLARLQRDIASDRGLTLAELQASDAAELQASLDALAELERICPICGAVSSPVAVPYEFLDGGKLYRLNDVWWGLSPPGGGSDGKSK